VKLFTGSNGNAQHRKKDQPLRGGAWKITVISLLDVHFPERKWILLKEFTAVWRHILMRLASFLSLAGETQLIRYQLLFSTDFSGHQHPGH
jgi:hypothetical protein